VTSKRPTPGATDPLPPAAMQTFRQAMAAHQAGKFVEAEALYRNVLDVDAKQFPVLLMLGILHAQRGNYREAEELMAGALRLNPNDAGAHFNYGNVLLGLQRFDEALSAFEKALALDPRLAEAHLNRGNILMMRKDFDEAIACFDVAISINTSLAGAHCNRGNALEELRRFDDALMSYDRALALDPHNAEFHASRANLLHRMKRYNEALDGLGRALAIQDKGEFHYNRGNILFELKRPGEAFAAYDKALALEPALAEAEGLRLHAKMQICDWSKFDAECEHLISSIRGGIETPPFALLAVSSSADDQLQWARLFNKKRYSASAKPISQANLFDHDRIRIAYLSADFGQSPTSSLLAGVFEQHDRKRFETFAVSFERHKPSEMLSRLKGSFDQFIDGENRSDIDLARLLHEHQIDIAVDLMGYTRRSRTSIFALRPSPIQINYLGYPGTMGADYIDYIIADRFIIPDTKRHFYSEKIIYMPETFQANDSKRKIDSAPSSRAGAGLPENAFVFCSFNNSYKITPVYFDIWMRLLRQIDGSVLWLLGGNNDLERNLRKEAEDRGVNAARLIFATRVAYANYLARFRLADLFLDTFPFNAGTTASDALWAGLPLVTCSGETFASRMAGSLLRAVGLPEMVTESTSAYEALVCKLARNPDLMAAIRNKLAANLTSYPLFNTQLFTRHIEKAYTAIWERHRARLPAQDIHIAQ
jgi:predicted O-linked N-acetylglucosamine transferase (SPINDLY family)